MFRKKTDTVEVDAIIRPEGAPQDVEGDLVTFVFKRPSADQEAKYEDNRVEFSFDRTGGSETRGTPKTYKMSLDLFDKLLTDVRGAWYFGPEDEHVDFDMNGKPIPDSHREFLGIKKTADIFPNNVKYLTITQVFNAGNVDIEAVKKK